MRATKRKRPQVRKIGIVPPNVDLERIANRATYVGSPEHKDTPSLAGAPRPRADASICDRRFAQDFDEVRDWLRQAILSGNVSEYWEGDFPRYVWYQDGDTVYEGRLVNREAGSYKGFPLLRFQWPEGMKAVR
jgi:hypothetical protein